MFDEQMTAEPPPLSASASAASPPSKGASPFKARASSCACSRPSMFNGESNNTLPESSATSILSSLSNAATSLKGINGFGPLLNTKFHSLSP